MRFLSSLVLASALFCVEVSSAQEQALRIKASDGDLYDITINTSDQALFQNAAAYSFDNVLILLSTITFPDGVRQTFNPNATTPGLNFGSQAGDPSTPSNGDMWYNSTTNKFRAYQNGAFVDVIGGGSGTITAVGPAFSSGAAFTDAAVSTGTTMLIWEGTTSDANEFSLIAPSANPGSDIDITFPSTTGTLLLTQGMVGDTVMIQVPAALFDTTKSGGPDWKEAGLFRSFYWEFNGSVAETLIVRDDAAVDLPGYFSSFIRVEGQWEAEQTGTDSLRVHAQGFSHDAAHTVSSLSLTTKNFAILSSGTGPAANDWRSDAKDPTVTGTFSANQHLHMIATRGAADTGVMRFYGIKLYFLRVK